MGAGIDKTEMELSMGAGIPKIQIEQSMEASIKNNINSPWKQA